MIELRWKEILSKVEHNGHRPVVKTVLQYRQQIDKTPYAQMSTNALTRSAIQNGHRTLEWSEWCDVPTIQETPI